MSNADTIRTLDKLKPDSKPPSSVTWQGKRLKLDRRTWSQIKEGGYRQAFYEHRSARTHVILNVYTDGVVCLNVNVPGEFGEAAHFNLTVRGKKASAVMTRADRKLKQARRLLDNAFPVFND